MCSRVLGELGAGGEDTGDQPQVLLARLVLRKRVRFVLQLDGPRVAVRMWPDVLTVKLQ